MLEVSDLSGCISGLTPDHCVTLYILEVAASVSLYTRDIATLKHCVMLFLFPGSLSPLPLLPSSTR